MNKFTTNYNLDLYDVDDKPNLNDQYNDAMYKIDTELDKQRGDIVNAETAFKNLETKVEGDIADIEAEVAGFDGRVTAAQTTAENGVSQAQEANELAAQASAAAQRAQTTANSAVSQANQANEGVSALNKAYTAPNISTAQLQSTANSRFIRRGYTVFMQYDAVCKSPVEKYTRVTLGTIGPELRPSENVFAPLAVQAGAIPSAYYECHKDGYSGVQNWGSTDLPENIGLKGCACWLSVTALTATAAWEGPGTYNVSVPGHSIEDKYFSSVNDMESYICEAVSAAEENAPSQARTLNNDAAYDEESNPYYIDISKIKIYKH